MKNSILLIFILSTFVISAQKISDASYTDCNNVTQSIYGELAKGKVLFITLKGLDCSVCKSHAANFGSYITANKNSITGWGAMIWVYNQSKVPTCAEMNSWNSTYNWGDVFQFADANLDFLVGGVPRYIVVDPADSTIAYDGPNINTAQSTATSLISTVGIETQELKDVKLYQSGQQIVLEGLPIGAEYQISALNIVGQELAQWKGNSEGNTLLSAPVGMESGIHLIRIESKGQLTVKRLNWIVD